jgi:hypothetical protein
VLDVVLNNPPEPLAVGLPGPVLSPPAPLPPKPSPFLVDALQDAIAQPESEAVAKTKVRFVSVRRFIVLGRLRLCGFPVVEIRPIHPRDNVAQRGVGVSP